MDPFSITVGCAALLELVVKVSKSIGAFVKDVRQARRDMEAVSRELVSLNIVLELLVEDTKQDTVKLPLTLSRQVSTIVSNCTTVVQDIENCMKRHQRDSPRGNLGWASNGREEVAQLLRGLEAHKAALELGLDTLTFHLAKEIKADTQEILNDTTLIREDTAQILEAIERLKARLKPGTSEAAESDIILQRYLEQLTIYTESEPAPIPPTLGSVSRASSISTESITPSDENSEPTANIAEPSSQAAANPTLSTDVETSPSPLTPITASSDTTPLPDPETVNTGLVDVEVAPTEASGGEVVNSEAEDVEGESASPQVPKRHELDFLLPSIEQLEDLETKYLPVKFTVTEASDNSDPAQRWRTQEDLRGYSRRVGRRGSDTSMRCHFGDERTAPRPWKPQRPKKEECLVM